MIQRVYDTHLTAQADEVDGPAWDALLASQPRPTPFMRHAYLAALQNSASACTGTGWTPIYLTLCDSLGLAAAAALYLKTHSYGEYVFDWAWADAYQRHGLAYYPKLLGAVPFTPVPGTRLLARDAGSRLALVQAIQALAEQRKLSSAHLLFLEPDDVQAARAAGWMVRSGVQFHWTQDPRSPVSSFAELLASMRRHKRKNIEQERRRVVEQGVTFKTLQGAHISEELWSFFYRCYTLTYRAHGSSAYLSREFFRAMAQDMPHHWVMFVATLDGERIAASLVAVDREQGAAYGRYWGCTRHIPHLHFEACYYQPLQWCIEQGLLRFEGGAQGEHKMARGLMPVPTHSAHWIADSRFASAVDDFLAREGAGVEQYLDELREHAPFRLAPASSPSSPSPI